MRVIRRSLASITRGGTLRIVPQDPEVGPTRGNRPDDLTVALPTSLTTVVDAVELETAVGGVWAPSSWRSPRFGQVRSTHSPQAFEVSWLP